MTIARQQLVSTDVTSYYHCVSRCVRRSFLCGKDTFTNRCYEHRREWIEQKIYSLTNVYCIDICAYAIMSNHYHLVVNINQNRALKLTLHEVVERWSQVHKLPVLIQRWQNKQLTSLAEQTRVSHIQTFLVCSTKVNYLLVNGYDHGAENLSCLRHMSLNMLREEPTKLSIVGKQKRCMMNTSVIPQLIPEFK